MKVKSTNPEAVIRDPDTKIQLSIEGDEVPESIFWTRRWLAGEVMRQRADGAWERRLPSGEVSRVPDAPTGNEPITPLTTRA